MIAAPGPERGRAIPGSHLHEVHQAVEARPGPTLALHVGEPYVPVSKRAREAMVRALRDGRTAYTDAPGLRALREALVVCHPVPDTSFEHIFVTPGSCQGIAAVLQSVARPGGSVLLPDVHWPIHRQQVILAGLEPVFYRLSADRDELVDALESVWAPSVCMVLVNTPANPSGCVLPAATVAGVYGWASSRRVPVLSDEAYEDFVYAGAHASIAACEVDVPAPDRLVYRVTSFSKGHSMTGCRLGTVVAPQRDRAEMLRRVQEATLVAPSTPVQYAGLAALADPDHLRRHHEYVRDTRDTVCALLDERDLMWAVPAGGWYVMVDLSRATDDARAWSRGLLDETDVSVTPGYGFFPPEDPRGASLVRLSLCGERETTVVGVLRLVEHLGTAVDDPAVALPEPSTP